MTNEREMPSVLFLVIDRANGKAEDMNLILKSLNITHLL